MSKMSALEAKNGFGQFLDAAQRAPVTVTKNGREVGTMFSQADLMAMGEAYLSEPLREAVAQNMPISEALLCQAEMNRRLDAAEAEVAAGRVHLADGAYFERLRDHVRQVVAKR